MKKIQQCFNLNLFNKDNDKDSNENKETNKSNDKVNDDYLSKEEAYQNRLKIFQKKVSFL